MTRKNFIKIFLTAMLILSPYCAVAAEDPAMVIRFNKDQVFFEKQLSKLVEKAKTRKADVRFKLVLIVNKATSKQGEPKAQTRFMSEVNRAVHTILTGGIAADHLSTQYQEQPLAPYNELHVFAE